MGKRGPRTPKVWVGDRWLDENRFQSLTEQTPGCWLWRGPLNNAGYGMVGFRKTYDQTGPEAAGMMTAHRAAWQLEHQVAIPPDQEVQHSCHILNCVNPAHLSLGTRKEKIDAMIRDNRHGFQLYPGRLSNIDRSEWSKHWDGKRKYTNDQIQWGRAAPIDDIADFFGVDRKKASGIKRLFRDGYKWLPYDRVGTRLNTGRKKQS